MSDTYADVDNSTDPVSAMAWQDRVNNWETIRAYKERMSELVASDRNVLDVGCGTGDDVVSGDQESALGVDSSFVMCREAAGRGAVVCRADAHHLPFAGGCFDACRADRVMQHLADPLLALAEMIRVVRPGGRLIVADPDQESVTICLPGVRAELVARVKALRRDLGVRNGRVGSSMAGMLGRLGLSAVSVEPFTLVLTDPADAFGLSSWPAYWLEKGHFTQADIAEWQSGIEGSADGGFIYAVTYFVVAGTCG